MLLYLVLSSKVEVVWGTFVVVLEKTTQAIGENGTMHSTLPYPTPPATSIGSVVNASSHFRRVEVSLRYIYSPLKNRCCMVIKVPDSREIFIADLIESH